MEDLSALRDLRSADWVDLTGAHIIELKPLGQFKSMKYLSVDNTLIGDLSELGSCESLRLPLRATYDGY